MPPEFNGVFGSHTQDRSQVGLETHSKEIGSHTCRAAIFEGRAEVMLAALVRSAMRRLECMLWDDGGLVGDGFG